MAMAAMRVSIALLSAKRKNHAGRHGDSTSALCIHGLPLQDSFGVRCSAFASPKAQLAARTQLIVAKIRQKSRRFLLAENLFVQFPFYCQNVLHFFIN
jgi:hypothetical protein